MSIWPSVRARVLLQALLRMGWTIKRQSGSHRVLGRTGFPDYVFPFHDSEEVGPRMLARVAKHTGLTPDDL
ncbi:MAG TPA: type II toxin-antitoxin system HicA family toxin [Rhodanobacteraceae bacterium]|nr:type II toxin-antitoxin system HicA family toxin [Rhodanobacteraceae bacterium]